MRAPLISSDGANAGAKPELGWLPVTRLLVDARYQRTLDSTRSKKLIALIEENFNWSAFQAIVVTPQGKDWLTIDGQHRTEAAKRRGETHVPAVIIKDASLAEQAAIFVRANRDRVSVTPLALFQARLVAGDSEAHEIVEICASAGVTIAKSQVHWSHLKPKETLAVNALFRLQKKYPRDQIIAALKKIVAVQGALDARKIKRAVTGNTPAPRVSDSATDEFRQKPIYQDDIQEEAPIVVASLPSDERFARLVRSGASIKRLADAFGMSETEARRKAEQLERA